MISEFKVNRVYEPLYKESNNVRYILLEGGRGGGRSFEGSQFAVFQLQTQGYFRGAVMRQVKETIKESIWQDVIDRIDEQNLTNTVKITESPLEIELNNKRLVAKAFKSQSSNQTAKNKSLAGFNFILIEEAEEIEEDDFNNLDVSLRKKDVDITIVLLFNPVPKNHWINKKWFNLLPTEIEGFFRAELREERKNDTLHIHATYHNNIKNLNQSTITILESYKNTNPDYYFQMICGLVPSQKTGLIFKSWNTCTRQEYELVLKKERFGMDFGANDPTVLVGVKIDDNKIYIDEKFYQSNMTLNDIVNSVNQFNLDSIITADGQAKQTIDSLTEMGLWLKSSQKGQGSVLAGIKKINNFKIFITEESKNIIAEFQNYTWKKNKNKEPLDEPIDEFNHGIDSIRYAIEDYTSNELLFEVVKSKRKQKLDSLHSRHL